MSHLVKMFLLIWKYLKVHKRLFLVFVILTILESLAGLANTFVLGNTIDSMLQSGTKSSIIMNAFVFLGISVMTFLIVYFEQTRGQRIMELTVKECKLSMLDHVERTSLQYIKNIGSASLIERMNYDIQMVVMFVMNAGSIIPEKIIAFLVATIIIMRIDVVCGMLAVLELPVIVLLYQLFKKKIFLSNKEAARKREEEYAGLCENVADLKHIKLNQLGTLLRTRYSEKADRFITAANNTVKISGIYKTLNDNVSTILKIILFFYGGLRVLEGRMTVGNFTVIYSYFTFLNTVCSYFLNIGGEIESTRAFYERIEEIDKVPEETNGSVILERIRQITLESVSFGYGENIILKEWSQEFTEGKLYVIAGKNGCGKSTMVSLLLGMYLDEHQGNIKYNGCPIKELNMRALRKERIGVCEQEPYLLDDTIRYNMIYSNDKADDDKLMQLSRYVSFDGFLKSAEQGLDTPVGENGSALSGGQKQKTALVKVFYKNPDVLILDEPTSAMDAEGQERLTRYLNEIKKDKIIIVITHDERIVEAADEVVRM